jgi:hydroxymethylglutaryl-CoA synthase
VPEPGRTAAPIDTLNLVHGVLGWGVHVPYRRLDLTTIAAVAGKGGGRGTRAVASFDEDSTTMAVEAGRAALRGRSSISPSLRFTTTTPAYLDKTNATAIHAALQLDRARPAYDMLGASRSWMGAFRAAVNDPDPVLVIAADMRLAAPGSADEAAGADAAAAILLGTESDGPVLADVLAVATLTEEFLERWRLPEAAFSRTWEERFGDARYVPLGTEILKSVLAEAEIDAADVDRLIVTGLHERAVSAVVKQSGIAAERVAPRLAGSVGNPGAAQPALLLAATLEQADPDQVLVLVTLADGADAVVLRTRSALADYRAHRPVAEQAASGGPVTYGRYLAWRGLLPVDPPRRPAPQRPSAPAAQRSAAWKYGFVGSQDEAGNLHLPPAPSDDLPRSMADIEGQVVTFTVDRLAYSPSPPVVFAVVNFDGGGRTAVELTDVDANEVRTGMRVEMTFRRLFTADAIHNYFWKARPVRTGMD